MTTTESKPLTPAQQRFYGQQKPADYEATVRMITKIVESANELTPFEAGFVTELARMARQFKQEFRLSVKQDNMLKELWLKYVFPAMVAAKTKKRKKVKKPDDK